MMLVYSFIILGCFSLTFGENQSFVFPCWTPNNESALCTSLFSCPVLMKALGTLQPSAINFVMQSVCYDLNFMVCCGTHGNFVKLANTTILTQTEKTTTASITIRPNQQGSTTGVESHRDFVKSKLLPTRTYCGLQHTDDRFYNEAQTAVDEFPWLVYITFIPDDDDDPLQYLDRCSGVLISNRYVLTTGVCANLVSLVRVGQHHTNKTISCADNPDFPECTEPRYDVMVEEEIHRTNGTIAKHDFALLRLNRKLTYTDFIRPICLPFSEPGDPEKRGSLVFSGWGSPERNPNMNKKRLIYNMTNIDKCFRLDDSELKEYASNVSVLCLAPGQQNEELACTGDEGGPLMFSHKYQWFVEGLVTTVYDWFNEFKVTGVKKNITNHYCSNELPVSGIKITSEVLDWIMDNMRL